MQTQTEKRYYTREEYLALEEVAESKSEYRDGEIVPMAGGTTNHNHIIVNLVNQPEVMTNQISFVVVV